MATQQAVDLRIKLIGPDGRQLAEVNAEPEIGSESISAVAETAGEYRLEVAAVGADAQGRYEIKIDELREAKPEDRDRIAAERTFWEADRRRLERTAESLPRAAEGYEKVLAYWRATGDKFWEGYTLKLAGVVYAYMDEHRKALEYYTKALDIWKATGNQSQQPSTLNNMGYSHSRLGDARKALEYYQQALPLYRTLGQRDGEATALSNIGLEYNALGDGQKALEHFNQSIVLARALGLRGQEAIILNNIGLTYGRLGEPQKALEYYEQALPVLKATGNTASEAVTLNNIGQVYTVFNQSRKALEYLRQALILRRRVGDRGGEVFTLHITAGVYYRLGEHRKALEYYEQALSLVKAVGERRAEASTLHNMALSHWSLGESDMALDRLTRALPLRRAVGDRRGEAYTLTSLGAIYYHRGELPMALDYLNQALVVSRSVGDKFGEVLTLTNIAELYLELNEPQKAQPLYQETLTITNKMGYLAEEARALCGVARVEREQGQLAPALAKVGQALGLIESMRTEVPAPDIRASFLASARYAYELYVDLLMRMHQRDPASGYDAKALHSSERARARSLIELLTEARSDIRRGIDPALKDREEAVLGRMSWVQNQLIQAQARPQVDATRVKALDDELKKLEDERQQIGIEIRDKHPRYAALQYPQALDLKAIRQTLDDDAVLLEYLLGKEKSFLFAISKTNFQVVQLPSAASITEQVKRLRDAITSGANRNLMSNYVLAAAALHRDLIEPAARLLAGKKKLIIAADGILHYLPFEVLLRSTTQSPQPDLRRLPYLVRDYAISYVPSATVLASLNEEEKKRQARPKAFLAYGDPLYWDKEPDAESAVRAALRSTLGGSKPWDLKRLPYSRQEVEQIGRLFPKDQVSILLGGQASEANVKSGEVLSDYRFVHFAVHGLVNESYAQYSGLILTLLQDGKGNLEDDITPQSTTRGIPASDSSTHAPRPEHIEDGLLQVYEIFNLNLNADMVVLSACETGLGREVRGEGLMGLARAFLYAGSSSVAVSLWKIEDRSTADLMVRFYRRLREGNVRRTEGLRQAQLELIGRGEYAHPYYWAGFILIGQP